MNLISLVKPAHKLEIGNRKTSAKFFCKFFGNLTQLLFAISGTLVAILFMLNNDTPHIPVGGQKFRVDVCSNLLPGVMM